MKLNALLLLSTLGLGAVNGERLNRRHIAKRQAAAGTIVTTTAVTSPATVATTTSTQASTTTTAAAPAGTTTSTTSTVAQATTAVVVSSSTSSTTAAGQAGLTTTVSSGPPALATGTTIPPLSEITLGMPTRVTLAAETTITAGATPPISGAPVIPTPAASDYVLSSWPAQDKIPPTDSTEVQEWLKELDGYDIPDLSLTVNGSCAASPAQAADAANRGWWTCGGYTRLTDIVACPTKYDWGVSFDDGPSGYSAYLLDFLEEKDISATFFVVGSRVIERPAILLEEYMAGHEISVHTWSHSALTNLTNEQIVAELGWTRKAIKTFLGVTPTTMRPPYGDIDDRVRAISLAMGMVPIMWTRSPSGAQFDTNDWRVAGGQVAGNDSFASFEEILGNATLIDTGFIVLQHDLFEISVDLAVGYTLDAALTHSPAFDLKSIGSCSGIPEGNMYLETNTNTTFPYSNSTSVDVSGDGTVDTQSGTSNTTSGTTSGAFTNAIPFISSMGVGLAALSVLL
ncbi:carbohydrate esterase family 4 protein [Hypholoma sublateritium FD-334 SS-4]|uniref:chitin deacetylase n=1 Tax=Hypholoma sublateritium (strain FD-334 SS-4) TaxID=945553 RepID=A0A0D2Q8S8_HYPSF|nr:carbohydrate esterase family 4 protein [Hypholoma sublateritium FD-334 SS-4]